MGYYYEFTYKKDKDNLVAGSLSRTFDDHVSLSTISMPIPNWLQSVQQGYANDSSLSKIIQQLANNPSLVLHSSWDGSSLQGFGQIFRWISLMGSLNMDGRL